MYQTQLQPQDKPKGLKLWLCIFLFVGTVIGTIFDFYTISNTVVNFVNGLNKPNLSLTFAPDVKVRKADYIEMNYSAPAKGYLSMWNWNGRGEIKPMRQSFALNESNQQGSYTLKATELGMEHVILVWSEKLSDQIAPQKFNSGAAFNSALSAKGKRLYTSRQSVQVYASDAFSKAAITLSKSSYGSQ